MNLVELSATNFMPYRGRIEVQFPTDPDKNVMLVFGENMRGKTSLLNVLRWTFYGNALGRHSREIALQDMVNREATKHGDWTMETKVVFNANGSTYEMRRRAHKRALVAVPERPADFEVVRALIKDGMPMGDHLIDAEMSHIAPQQTSRFFLFDGELLQEYESLLIDGSEQGKKIKAAIEQALGVPSLVRGREDLQTLLKAAQKQQTQDVSKMAGFERHAERQAELQTKIASLETDVLALESLLVKTHADRLDHEDFVNSTAAFHDAKVRLEEREDRLREITTSQKEKVAYRLILVQDVWRDLLRPMLTLKRDHLLESLAGHNAEITARAQVLARIEKLKDAVVSHTCDSCGQPLHEAQRERAGTELGKLQADLVGMHVDPTATQALWTELNGIGKLLRPGTGDQIATVDRELMRWDVEATKIDHEIERLKDSIAGQDTVEIARRRTLAMALNKEEGRLEQDIKNRNVELDKAKKDLSMTSRMLEGLPGAKGARSALTVGITSTLERIFSDSIERLRDDLREKVQALASEAFSRLTTQSAYSGLRINNNYGLTILDERGDDVPLRSAGAEQIVALSLIDGLTRAGRAFGPVVMDTPFGRLDPGHRANILKYLPSTATQLVLLVHDGEVDRARDLDAISDRIGCVYEIKHVSARESRIERITQ